jgi:ribosome-binding protein aMBF1 (putative translation factor)
MSGQGWQTVTYNKPKKAKEEAKFDPIPARQREAQAKIDAENAAKKQIKVSAQIDPNQDWKTITFTKSQEKPKVVLPQREVSAIKTNESGDIVQVKKVSQQMAKSIIDARITKKWTQVQLAHNSAVDVKTIGEVERGGGLYDANVFNKLCKTLGVQVERNCVIEKKN